MHSGTGTNESRWPRNPRKNTENQQDIPSRQPSLPASRRERGPAGRRGSDTFLSRYRRNIPSANQGACAAADERDVHYPPHRCHRRNSREAGRRAWGTVSQCRFGSKWCPGAGEPSVRTPVHGTSHTRIRLRFSREENDGAPTPVSEGPALFRRRSLQSERGSAGCDSSLLPASLSVAAEGAFGRSAMTCAATWGSSHCTGPSTL